MKIRPLHDRVLIERVEEKEVKKGAIIIPDTAKEKHQEGQVLTVGSGMVTVEVNGKQELLSVKIDREVINPHDSQMLEDLILAACNEALRKSREMVQAEMSKLTAGLKLPGLGM